MDIPTDFKSARINPNDEMIFKILGIELPKNRESIRISTKDVLYVIQYTGPKVNKGKTKLPKGGKVNVYEVTTKGGVCQECPNINCKTCRIMNWIKGR